IFFQENFLGWADGIKQGAFYFGIRDGRFAPLNVGDIGEIAANILASSGHEGKAYVITGPELLTGDDFAKVFAEVTGKPVNYVSPDPATTLESLLGAGWPAWQAKGMLELFEVFATNQAAVVSPDGERLLGRPLTSVADYVRAYTALSAFAIAVSYASCMSRRSSSVPARSSFSVKKNDLSPIASTRVTFMK